MDRREAIETLMNVFEPAEAASHEVISLAQRFRTALMDANPDLVESDMRPYDDGLTEELPVLNRAVRSAHIEVLAGKLTDEEVSAWIALASLPGVAAVFGSLRRLAPDLNNAAQGVFRFEGVGIHTRCAQRLFDSIGASSEDEGNREDSRAVD